MPPTPAAAPYPTGFKQGSIQPDLPGVKANTPIADYLKEILDSEKKDLAGNNASYIPMLKNADPNHLAVCMATIDGFIYSAGDADVEFSIQSISKAFVYALILEQHGKKWVLDRIGDEPSGEPFNQLALDDKGRPKNPLINVGAITAHSYVGDPRLSLDERFEIVRKGLSDFAGRDLKPNMEEYESELKTAFRNRALANICRSTGAIEADPDDVVAGYTRQCSIYVTARDLVVMAATLANEGVQPVTKKRIVSREVVRQVLSVMLTCGMYDESGDWVADIGMPAKSGVGGGILAVAPGQLAISTFSPRLDEHGNSLRGVRICTKISKDNELHIMDAPQPAKSILRRDYLLRSPDNKVAAAFALQGGITFTTVEAVMRRMAERTALGWKHPRVGEVHVSVVILDLRTVSEVKFEARKLMREMLTRLHNAGMTIIVVDPDDVLETKSKKAGAAVDSVIDNLKAFHDWKRIDSPDAPDAQ